MTGFQRRIAMEGLNLERFIRCAGERGIRLDAMERSGARRITAVVNERQLKRVREIAEDGGWRMTEGDSVGMRRMAERLGGRWLLLALLVVIAIGMIGASQFIWRIRVYDAGTYAADIRETLTEMGVCMPMPRAKLELQSLREELEWRYPQVAWVECGLRGMCLEIRMVEGVNGEATAEGDGPCDVVATRTGIVQRIVTRAGTPVVKAGEMVNEGDLLIQGVERTAGGEVRQVAASGSVYARVWDSAAVQTSLYVVESEPTGRTQTVWNIQSPWFSLWRSAESGYLHEDAATCEIAFGGFFWPLKLRTETRIETDYRSVKTDVGSVAEENNRIALLKLYELVGGKESLVDNWVNWSIIEDEKLLSVATGERLMDIARQERSSGMAATE